MLNRWIEKDLLSTLKKLEIGCIAFSPLAQGMLSEKYLKNYSLLKLEQVKIHLLIQK